MGKVIEGYKAEVNHLQGKLHEALRQQQQSYQLCLRGKNMSTEIKESLKLAAKLDNATVVNVLIMK